MNAERSSNLEWQLFFMKNALCNRLSLNNKCAEHFYFGRVLRTLARILII
jgi:hypothetical protein